MFSVIDFCIMLRCCVTIPMNLATRSVCIDSFVEESVSFGGVFLFGIGLKGESRMPTLESESMCVVFPLCMKELYENSTTS